MFSGASSDTVALVPEGHLIIARRFNAGLELAEMLVPKGRCSSGCARWHVLPTGYIHPALRAEGRADENDERTVLQEHAEGEGISELCVQRADVERAVPLLEAERTAGWMVSDSPFSYLKERGRV